ncbi:DUF2178 domain-containing protein [Methanosarcina sp. MSH10X1]|uniref:DUF2178 domain-containing protein n=1 Tax=Methanosarcina sp. MSH10X1 TaxID=2507075 RepID=UPI000FFB8418|nr:DUF2178 domain-containing protein [Methanosarcina sp. MSH10X1]RXA18969.1 DUF2178 domain-containing protein [Methanosarcina sp. MSH10X1]
MKWKQFRIISLLIVTVLGAVVGFSVSSGNLALAAGAAFTGMAAMYISRHRVEDIVEDERIRQVSQRASWVTLQFTAIGFALGGAILIAMREAHPGYVDLGFFMAYASCAVLVLYSIFYMYFNLKSGG